MRTNKKQIHTNKECKYKQNNTIKIMQTKTDKYAQIQTNAKENNQQYHLIKQTSKIKTKQANARADMHVPGPSTNQYSHEPIRLCYFTRIQMASY